MPRIKIGQQTTTDSLQQTIADRIKAGRLVPIISHSIMYDLVVGTSAYEALVESYAQQVNYSSPYQRWLPQISQYVSVIRELVADREGGKEFYLKFAKSWLFDRAEAEGLSPEVLEELDEQFDDLNFSALAQGLGYPKFKQGAADPLLVLANLPLSIYITTSYHYFLETALKRANRLPHTAICPWREGLETRSFTFDAQSKTVFDADYQPSQAEPLVYHLHGFDRYPQSLVLTEDDYLEFLVAISRDKGRNTDPIPRPVREALVESSLLMLGFGVRSWAFRVIFWGLIKTDFKRRYKSVSVQLELDDAEEKYLQQYLSEADFEVYRGDIQQFALELRQSFQ
jgi:hypothetical protein